MTIQFIADDGNEHIGDYIPLAVKKMLAVLERMERGAIRPSSWLLRESNCESSNGKHLKHPLIMPYRIKCGVDGIDRVWFGHPADIKAKKAEFDKKGKAYRD